MRDLVDMVLLIQAAALARNKITEAIRVTFERRETHLLPGTLPVPPAKWQNPYRALARVRSIRSSRRCVCCPASVHGIDPV